MASQNWNTLSKQEKSTLLKSAGLPLGLSQLSWSGLQKSERAKLEKAMKSKEEQKGKGKYIPVRLPTKEEAERMQREWTRPLELKPRKSKGKGWREAQEDVLTDKGVEKKAPIHREVAIKKEASEANNKPMQKPAHEEKAQEFDWQKIYNYPNMKQVYLGRHGVFERLEGKDKEKFIKALSEDVAENGSWEKAEEDAKEFFKTKGIYFNKDGKEIAVRKEPPLISDPKWKFYDLQHEKTEDERMQEERRREEETYEDIILPFDTGNLKEMKEDSATNEAYRMKSGGVFTEVKQKEWEAHEAGGYKVDEGAANILTEDRFLKLQEKYPLAMEFLIGEIVKTSYDAPAVLVKKINDWAKEESGGTKNNPLQFYDEKWFKDYEERAQKDIAEASKPKGKPAIKTLITLYPEEHYFGTEVTVVTEEGDVDYTGKILRLLNGGTLAEVRPSGDDFMGSSFRVPIEQVYVNKVVETKEHSKTESGQKAPPKIAISKTDSHSVYLVGDIKDRSFVALANIIVTEDGRILELPGMDYMKGRDYPSENFNFTTVKEYLEDLKAKKEEVKRKQQEEKEASERKEAEIKERLSKPPSGYFIHKQDENGDSYLEPVAGKVYQFEHQGIELFAFKDTRGWNRTSWNVSERRTGLFVSGGRTKAEAIQKAKEHIDKKGASEVKRQIKVALGKMGVR